MLFANERRARDVAAGDQKTLADHHEAKKHYAEIFRALPWTEQQMYIDKAARTRACRMPDLVDPDGDDAALPTASETDVCGLSTHNMPIDPDIFVDTILTHTQSAKELDDSLSFRTWGPQARNRFQEQVFVGDRCDIPKRTTLKVRLSCSQAHPGLCKDKDKTHLDLYADAGHALQEYLFRLSLESVWVRIYIALFPN